MMTEEEKNVVMALVAGVVVGFLVAISVLLEWGPCAIVPAAGTSYLG